MHTCIPFALVVWYTLELILCIIFLVHCLVHWEEEASHSIVPVKAILGEPGIGERCQVRWGSKLYWGKCIGTGMMIMLHVHVHVWTHAHHWKHVLPYMKLPNSNFQQHIHDHTYIVGLGSKTEMDSLLDEISPPPSPQLSPPPSPHLSPPPSPPLPPPSKKGNRYAKTHLHVLTNTTRHNTNHIR